MQTYLWDYTYIEVGGWKESLCVCISHQIYLCYNMSSCAYIVRNYRWSDNQHNPYLRNWTLRKAAPGSAARAMDECPYKINEQCALEQIIW